MKSLTYYFHIKTKVLADFQICISVPLRLFPLVVEHSIVVMSARLNPMGSQFSILFF